MIEKEVRASAWATKFLSVGVKFFGGGNQKYEEARLRTRADTNIVLVSLSGTSKCLDRVSARADLMASSLRPGISDNAAGSNWVTYKSRFMLVAFLWPRWFLSCRPQNTARGGQIGPLYLHDPTQKYLNDPPKNSVKGLDLEVSGYNTSLLLFNKSCYKRKDV